MVLYMKFTKYMGLLFMILMALNMCILLPIYVTAKSTPSNAIDSISDFSVLTVANAKESSTRIWASFVFVVVNSAICLAFVHRFWRNSVQLKHRNIVLTQSRAILSEKDIALHTVMVRGLPRDLNPRAVQEEISKILSDSFADGSIVGVRVIG